jgi:hypothetical protein
MNHVVNYVECKAVKIKIVKNNMLYNITHWSPRQEMNGAGFSIELFPRWKEEIKISEINQENINNMIDKLSPHWFDGVGYDPKLYKGSIRVTWGEWGPEHICVPGNACGLDISRGDIFAGEGGAMLYPHNVDSIKQASLILSVFIQIANSLVSDIKCRELKS